METQIGTLKAKSKRKSLPAALWALTISAFGIGTTEFVIVGLLPTVANDLNTSISSAGLLVSLYAVGVAIGAPVLTALTSQIARKRLLIAIMLLFIIGNGLAAIAPSFILLILARILTGFAHGVFFSIGSTIAASLVPEDKRASAISIMFAGLTVAIVTGVPLGTYIGQNFGWRATFIGVAILGIIGAVASYFLVPASIKTSKPLRIVDQLKVLKNRSILLVLSITALGYGGTFVTFTYLASLLEEVTGFSANMTSILLLVYGIAIALGNVIGGKVSNKKPGKALMVMFALQAIVLLILYFTASSQIWSVVTLFFMGILAFSNVPALQLYVVKMSEKYLPGTEDVSSALNIAAFNVGIAIGAYVGGLIIESSLGVGATPWVGSILVIVGFLITLILYKKEKL
ncbi:MULTISPECIES: MFS transporter [Tenacibaculum]|uniref:MFS transporter n=1 Tax=Tenacibaculum mesophilum TaxID=104268 RepID=A0AAE9MQY3_9FLAO|nr:MULTISPECIES: MFS transporter [Tenacibaculum]GFD75978.1 chloramphenicol resistance protein [Tenacibaculum sp. KUL113]MCG7501532.1 MFS transporter [Tenacibaculum sp. Mcav3-52]MCO7184813.1 MFS transporter [Tenacibaculum sp. XPcli2-G]UTD16653.1 MFS transporter [Tenacibaculum mesophilum]BFF37106.1 MFS transporter [Tenacibaculum mesophilum]